LTTLNMENSTCERLFERVYNRAFPDTALLEDYALLIDYALDPSLDTYEVRITGNEIVVHQRHLNDMVGTVFTIVPFRTQRCWKTMRC
jgi:hypothetical protein